MSGKKKRSTEEHQNQKAFFDWIALNIKKYPDLEMCYSNTRANSNPISAAILKSEGVRKGIPDISLDIARHGFHGLRMELKTKRGRLTKEQTVWLDKLSKQGYMTVVCVGWEALRDMVIGYLDESI